MNLDPNHAFTEALLKLGSGEQTVDSARVFRAVYDITCGDYNWKVGKEEAPIRLKLLKGFPGLNNNDIVLYTTVECFISEGLVDERGETRVICRSMEVPEERGSKELVDNQNQEHSFILGGSRTFPIEILFSSKCEKVDEVVWRKQEEKNQSKSHAFVELLIVQKDRYIGICITQNVLKISFEVNICLY